MPIVIDQMDIQPAASSAGSAGTGNAGSSGGAGAAPNEQQKESEVFCALTKHRERHARLRSH
jgi:hypothetical protein